ncbi:MAG: shikimate kinase [Rhodopirellula sp. JB055]|uniref:shikimate kinase n=1 Tax=Rhodopirellula sp. JB055 TaxID=3342846 RepID=UPI00370CD0DA
MNIDVVKPQHLYLTGYRGCGKSTLAKLLARRLSVPVVDLDDVIESTAEKSITEIFADESERGFRDREEAALRDVAKRPTHVIALGGGTILREANRQLISQSGWCVWLDAEPEILVERLQGDATTADRRPSLTDQSVFDEVKTVMTKREPLYRASADLRVDTSRRTMDEILGEVLKAVPSSIGHVNPG